MIAGFRGADYLPLNVQAFSHWLQQVISPLYLKHYHAKDYRAMPTPSSLSATERQLRSRLHALLSRADGFLHGSPSVLMRKCGKANCQCASDDSKRHRSLSVGQTYKGETTTIHIPKELEGEVCSWIDNFNTALDLLEALNQQGRQRIKARKRKAKKRPGRKAGSPAGARRKTPSRKSQSSGES